MEGAVAHAVISKKANRGRDGVREIVNEDGKEKRCKQKALSRPEDTQLIIDGAALEAMSRKDFCSRTRCLASC